MTLFISDDRPLDLAKGQRAYLYVSAGCLVFSMIYECFSHNVFSPFMVFAVAFPLLGGCIATELLKKLPAKHHPKRAAVTVYNWGLATLTVGSILRGVLDIYGTENPLLQYYAIVGIGLVVASLALWVLARK